MAVLQRVCIYIFSVSDCRSIQQRLTYAVTDFCKRGDLPLPVPEALTTDRTEKGKPYFPNAPHLHLSISHSGQYWSCAICDETIGLDLQEKETPRNETVDEMLQRHQKMANRFFHPLEAAFISQNCAHNFLTVWTAREAYVKHTGQGIDRDFSEHCVIPKHPSHWELICGNTSGVSWSAMGKRFWKSCFSDCYVLCVCTESPCVCTIIPTPEMK